MTKYISYENILKIEDHPTILMDIVKVFGNYSNLDVLFRENDKICFIKYGCSCNVYNNTYFTGYVYSYDNGNFTQLMNCRRRNNTFDGWDDDHPYEKKEKPKEFGFEIEVYK